MQPLYVCSRCQIRQRLSALARAQPQSQLYTHRRLFSQAATSRQGRSSRSDLHQSWNRARRLSAPLGKRRQSTAQAKLAEVSKAELPTQQSPSPLPQENLFHPFSTSPAPDIRQRAKFIRRNAFCPHPSHQPTKLTQEPHEEENGVASGAQPPAHCSFECPDCGIPLYCSEEHWADDFESHLKVCDTLRQINEDDHDLRSGRRFSEFEYPGPQIIQEAVINMTNWDTLLYTRQFEAINEMQRLRQATRLQTYPMTVGSVIHELSPYTYGSGGRLTLEGVKSFTGM
jgi:hypothetical protein